MTKLHFLIFLTIFSSVYLGMHYYVYSRVAGGLFLPSNIRVILRIVFLLSALSFFIGETYSQRVVSPIAKPIAFYGTAWMGVIAIAITVFLLADILRIFFRSESFRYYSTISAVCLTLLLSAYSLFNGTRQPVVKTIELGFQKLPDNLNGFTIVHLSDLHINLAKSQKWLQKIIDKTNGLNPDLIVITGDLIDGDLCKANHFCDTLVRFKSNNGVYAIAGNHEFYAGIELFEKIAENSNITVLRNEKVMIADNIELIGIDDVQTAKRFNEPTDFVDKTLNSINNKNLVILLSHQPDVFDKARRYGVDLQLSGHTHAGQIPPFDIIVQFAFRYPYGLYKRGSSYIYTTSGTDLWGPPMRLFSKNEIIKIVLKK
ncbi:MAG: metallophosphoesterase [Endomicrobiales bacterium]|nr:metallophosphoesterase [Endomicrobiales bacterium]